MNSVMFLTIVYVPCSFATRTLAEVMHCKLQIVLLAIFFHCLLNCLLNRLFKHCDLDKQDKKSIRKPFVS